MATLAQKLQLKAPQPIVILNPPAEFLPSMAELPAKPLHHDLAGVDQLGFVLAFVTRKADVDALAAVVAQKAPGDAIVWFAYPKGSSKRYHCDFNRDTGWEQLHAAGFETVRAIAIDDDWTALRFRRSQFVKSRR